MRMQLFLEKTMPKTAAERQVDHRKRVKRRKAGQIAIRELFCLPEVAKLLRWGLRDKLEVLKPKNKEVLDNAREIMEQLRKVENE